MPRRTFTANPLSLLALGVVVCAAVLVQPALAGNALRASLGDGATPAISRAALKYNPGAWLQTPAALAPVRDSEEGALLAIPGMSPVAEAENRAWPQPFPAASTGRAPPGDEHISNDIC